VLSKLARSGGGNAYVRWGAPESSTASRSSSGQFEIVSEAWIGVLRHGMGGERCTSVRSDSARWHRWVGLLSSVKAAGRLNRR